MEEERRLTWICVWIVVVFLLTQTPWRLYTLFDDCLAHFKQTLEQHDDRDIQPNDCRDYPQDDGRGNDAACNNSIPFHGAERSQARLEEDMHLDSLNEESVDGVDFRSDDARTCLKR